MTTTRERAVIDPAGYRMSACRYCNALIITRVYSDPTFNLSWVHYMTDIRFCEGTGRPSQAEPVS